MTNVDVVFRYGIQPSERAVMALGRLREVYGIRCVELREAEKTVRVEYDATRLTDSIVSGLLRRTGIEVVEQVQLAFPPPPAPPAEALPAAAK